MPFDSDDAAKLILRIHAAVVEPQAWTSVAEELRRATNARGAIVHTSQVQSFDDYWCFLAEIDAPELAIYAREWMSQDVWFAGARRHGLYDAEGLVCLDDALVEHREFRQSSFFNDFLRANDIDRMVTMNLHRGRHSHGVAHIQLSLFRGVGKGAFSTTELALLEHLKPHLLIAARNYNFVRSLEATSAIAGNALGSLAAELYAIDRRGRLLYANRPAEDSLSVGKWLACVDGKLVAGEDIRNPELCAGTLRNLCSGVGATILLEHVSTGGERLMLTSPLVRDGATSASLPLRASGLIWLLPEQPSKKVIERFSRLFDLTPSETRLLALLAQGHELKTVAKRLEISIHTARNQLKAILRKSGRRNQGQLLALVNRMAAIVANDE